MNVLITGAGGFLGQELITQLCNDRMFQIIALTSGVEKLSAKFAEQENLQIYSLDDFYQEKIDFSQVDYLVNCAFPRGEEGNSFARGIDYIEDVLKSATRFPLSGVIDISSQSVYSQKRLQAATEEEPICLESKYAVGKYMVEKLVDAYCRNIPHVHIRMASLIGKDFDVRIVNKLVKRAVKGEQIVIQGGNQSFGFLDVRDAADGIIHVLKKDTGLWKNIYNLGPECAYTLNEIVTIIEQVGNGFGVKLNVQRVEGDLVRQNSGVDCTKFMQDFSWRLQFDLYTSVKDIFINEV